MLGAQVKTMVKMNKKRSCGFSMVELLVAMLVGLVIVSGVFAMHSATRGAQQVNEAQMDMVADARFAIELISYDLRHAGMWGGTNVSDLIDCRAGDASCAASTASETVPADVTVAKDCAGDDWYATLSQAVFATNNANPYSATCIKDEGYVAATDVLEIHYADSNPPVGLLANQTYIRSNFVNGRVFIGATQPVLDAYEDSPLTANHELFAYAYYISDFTDKAGDGIPSLRRAALVNGPQIKNQLLISGVADMQVQFGEDVDGDQIPDRYVNPNAVLDWKAVYAAKIWLVMQSDKAQKDIDTSKTFSIAGANKSFGGVDGFRFFMTSSVINLRNLKQL